MVCLQDTEETIEVEVDRLENWTLEDAKYHLVNELVRKKPSRH